MSGPVADLLLELMADARARHPKRPALIGIGGAQGSGKSTICEDFAAQSGGRVAHFSLDDVYLTRAERMELAASRHPLFVTRGPPGTHDLTLAEATIKALNDAKAGDLTPLPRFDKMSDDRAPRESWPVFEGHPAAILVDGWCMGAAEIEDNLEAPINTLEADEDADGAWRRQSLALLATDYWRFFDHFDAIIYLQAPSFEIVRAWRGEQEEEMLGRALSDADNAALDRFVQHYERVTRAMLEGNHIAGWIVQLDEQRRVQSVDRYE